uniref:Uncharacterized protein n=1 Tax=Knipowitschia caucasica TaxID=637954 RepID=A0AAV2LSP5_KNICA
MGTTQQYLRLTFHSPSTPLGRDPQITASPQTDDRRLLIAISGLSREVCGSGVKQRGRDELRQEKTGPQSQVCGIGTSSSQLGDEFQALRARARTNLSS